uniref:Zmp:0000001267 n=1 Tax=Gouania willdenowi TaxID=441366 RepID=A0A8C5E6X3_GOUWI
CNFNHHDLNNIDPSLKMKQEIGLVGGVALISGTMIGSGIFMSPQFVLAYVGSPGASVVIWSLTGLMALIFGSFPAFFAAVTFILVVKPLTIAISIAEYALAPLYSDCQPPLLAVKSAAALAILVVAMINILNVRIAIRIQVVFLVAKVVSLTVIVIGGFVEVLEDSDMTVENAFKGTIISISGIGMAFYQGLWSYAGWYSLNYVTEELKRPEIYIIDICKVIPLFTIRHHGEWLALFSHRKNEIGI